MRAGKASNGVLHQNKIQKTRRDNSFRLVVVQGMREENKKNKTKQKMNIVCKL